MTEENENESVLDTYDKQRIQEHAARMADIESAIVSRKLQAGATARTTESTVTLHNSMAGDFNVKKEASEHNLRFARRQQHFFNDSIANEFAWQLLRDAISSGKDLSQENLEACFLMVEAFQQLQEPAED